MCFGYSKSMWVFDIVSTYFVVGELILLFVWIIWLFVAFVELLGL
jgi:hypothetical protein